MFANSVAVAAVFIVTRKYSNSGDRVLVDLELPIFDQLIFIRPKSETVITSRRAACKESRTTKEYSGIVT